jgi:CRISPR-associated protein Csb2
MTTLSIRFLAGRFHATQWGRHVNEGVPEWPPSPWRILRSLIATWKSKCPEIDDAMAKTILKKLAELPDFALPPATVSHTRHYMPWDKNYAGHTTLVFDTFVAVPATAEVLVCWPETDLEDQERVTLSAWLQAVGYLGRAESWCEIRLLDQAEATTQLGSFNCRRLGTQSPEKNTEIVRVLCPDPVSAFLPTHTPKTTVKTGKGKTAIKTEIPHYDPNWHICGETLWLHKEKWAEAPGSRWIRYTRRADCFKISAKPRRTLNASPPPQVVRFALDSSVLPLVTETLALADATRWNLMGIHGGITARRDGVKGKSEVFSGKDANGNRIIDHSHCYFLPTDEDNDGRLDHLTLISEAGFGKDELAALNSLRQIKSRERMESGHNLGVILLRTGMLTQDHIQSPVAMASTWVSATPYLCHRHPKTRGSKKDSPEELASHPAFTEARLREDIARLLERRADLNDIPMEQIMISPCTDENGVFRLGTRRHRPIEFRRYRQKHGDDGGKRMCGAFVIEFPRDVRGPISLGHSCHYGMGLFLPWQEDDFETYKAMCARDPRLGKYREEQLRMLHFRQFIARD